MAQRYPAAQDVDAAPLGEPLRFAFSGRTASNRFMKASMTERCCTWSPKDPAKRGIPTDEIINLYRNWGTGGWGLVLTGNILIHPEHLEAAGNPVILADAPFEGERFAAYEKLAQAGKAGGSLLVGQVNHPGRQVGINFVQDPVSASDVHLDKEAFGMKFGKPHAASQDEIDEIQAAFVHAAVYLEKAGFDGIQLHGAHGYLIAQFLSETTNLRTDKYGGSLENRARFVTEIADKIRAQTKSNFILGIKINSVEFQERGLTTEDATAICQLLEQHKFDFVEISGGTYEETAWHHHRESTKAREAFFLDFADKITPGLTKTRSYVTGGLRSVKGMVNALQTVDGVGIGRPSCSEPRLPKDMLSGTIKSCIKPVVDEVDFGTTVMMSGAQMRQMGHNLEPFDPSVQENVDGFMKDLGAWAGAMAKNENGEFYGHVTITTLPAVPFACSDVPN